MRRLLAALVVGLLAAPASWAAEPCTTCAAAGGTYHAVAPPDWDGHTRLKLLMFLHGWRASGADMVDDTAVTGPAARLGFLLIAPDGLQNTWAHGGSPSQARDDVAFLRAVLADAEQRWPVDPRVVVAGGFSQGGSMVWDLACYAADAFTAFLPISGGFWEKMPDSCTAGAVNLRHTHGRADTTVPMAGRALFGPYRQADIRRGFLVWEQEDKCRAAPNRHSREGDLDCDIWSSCGSGRSLELCLHEGGHVLDGAWLESGLRWAMTLPAAERPGR
ncbi:alpha/beta hydrolase family esterase [Limobrevibacterium gyesilva]|uniref:Polyhydroxybutyrate depolymerase n=1 Tax=Limobrevibacterium gyesilva TaxID=2991712 RepID=A0AA41YIU3_9PROT|nr:hypothetical protein [Limobrevibacterium gyesilva]MCW3474411.1 hypothetical protein [Limobrevibacterium gyesilva]